MRIGVVLPSFRHGAEEALATARAAEEAGIDAIFCFDHLWPMGQPARPALTPFPLLAAVAASTERLSVGTLVARVGLVRDELLLAQFGALCAVAPGRVIAALGTGDAKSFAENAAYGEPAGPADERRAELARCAIALGDAGVPVWVGAGRRATNELARALGVALNVWGATPDAVAEHAAEGEVTWAGPPMTGADTAAITAVLRPIADAGATWAVLGSPTPIEALAEAAAALREGAP
jgi:alkanesulfonate monooxygenase SsuD/methylene tetrahydromethanopterin reductase-like flavin-dependent oxidoreductase (luciferase family)